MPFILNRNMKGMIVLLKSGDRIRVYDNDIAKNKSFFTGHVNDQALEFDPLVTGYSFILWTKVPVWLEREFPGFRAMTQKNFTAFDGLEDMEMQVVDYMHSFNENTHQVAGELTRNNQEFGINHKEYSGSPIGNMYKHWVSSIRDPRTGIATYPKAYNMEYGAKNHTGELLYITTRPDVNNVEHKNIEFAAYYTNVMPTRIQLSHFNFNLGDHDTVDYEQRFTGTMNIGAHVDNFAAEKLRETYNFVAQGMFDPENANVGEDNITVFNTENTGITGSGGGDI